VTVPLLEFIQFLELLVENGERWLGTGGSALRIECPEFPEGLGLL